MMNKYLKISLILFFVTVKSKIHGVADKDLYLYNEEGLKCPSTGKELTLEMINDGRCDCPDDGFDEPGTAACENGRFYCKNAKGLETYIPSFKVNDGVCDCCDGSDEYLDNFGINCKNTCDQLKSAKRREAYLEKAKISKAKRYYEKNKLEAKIKQEELKEKLAEINRKLNEISEKADSVSENTDDTENMDSFLADYRQKLDQLEALISNLTISEIPKLNSNDQQGTPTQNNQNSWRALIDIRLKRAKDIISKITSITTNKPTVTVTKYLPTIVTKTIVQYEPTTSYDERYQDMDYEKDDLVTQARQIEESMKNPDVYGPDSVFLALKDKCFEAVDGGFTYSICWFDEAKQDSHTKIGKWSGQWGQTTDKDGNTVKDFKHMIYGDGNWCGSKARETHVHLQCGWSDEILSVTESSTCNYVFKFSTPLACIL